MSLLHFHLHPIPPQPKLTTPLEKKKPIEHRVIQFLYTCTYQRERDYNDDTMLFVPVSLREQYQYLQYFLNVLEDCVKKFFLTEKMMLMKKW